MRSMFTGVCCEAGFLLASPVLLGFCCDASIFIFIFFNMGFCSSGILVDSGQWWRGGHGGGTVVVTKQWRCSDRG